jgi:ectoine hydrolase
MRYAGKVIEGVYERVMEVAKPGMRKNELGSRNYACRSSR